MAPNKKGCDMARNKSVKMTLTEDEFRQISDRAERSGLSIASLTRSAALALEIPKPRVDIDRAAIVSLNRVGVNLNQIAKAANSRGFLTDPQIRILGGVLRNVQDAIQRIEKPSP